MKTTHKTQNRKQQYQLPHQQQQQCRYNEHLLKLHLIKTNVICSTKYYHSIVSEVFCSSDTLQVK